MIGGGFSGLVAARVAASRGIRVTVLERKRVLGEPVRTSGGSWIQAMEMHRIPAHLYHPVRVARLWSRSREVCLSYPEPPGCILHVAELVRYLGDQARRAGAEVVTGVEVRGLELEEGAPRLLRTSRGDWRGDFLVDASGVGTFLARQLEGRRYRRFGVGHEVTVHAPDWPLEEVGLWVGPPMAPSGYAWAFPEGEGRVRLGSGILRPDQSLAPRQALERMLHAGRSELAALRGARVLETRTGVIPAEPAPLPLHGTGWLQVGDSASQASPLLGEGIRFCLEMGEVAGSAAATWLGSSDPIRRQRALERYAETFEARYGPKFRLEFALNRRLGRLDAGGWDRALDLLADLAGDLPVELLRGDWTPSLLLGIAWRRPGLAWSLARRLLAR